MTTPFNEKLKCFQVYPRSLNKAKLSEFKTILSYVNPHLVFLSETFWKPHINPNFHGYSTFRSDRVGRHGGGVALLIKTDLNPQEIKSKPINKFEHIAARIHLNKVGYIDIISAYCPSGDANVDDL